MVLFEGRDAAGKGGAIKRFTEHLNPRGARTVALAKPTDAERTQWYFQRYVAHLPSAGEIVLFDRSWYNRAGVERVMGFCTDDEYAEFMRQVPALRAVAGQQRDQSVQVVVHRVAGQPARTVRAAPQATRCASGSSHRSTRRACDLYDEYTAARNDMLRASSSEPAPWTVVNSNDKRRARLNSIRAVLDRLDYEHKDHDAVDAADPHVVRPADELHIDD